MPHRPARLPRLWLLSDARNDAGLAAALAKLPRGSGLVFRHYHLPAPQRKARYAALARLARAHGHAVVLAGTMAQARAWRADGAYGPASAIGPGGAGLRLGTAHTLRELRQALAARADLVLISPVFATRSHPGAGTLGALGCLRLAGHNRAGASLALGGMTQARWRQLAQAGPATRPHGWAAIDGLAHHKAGLARRKQG
jgi:thiamine-phosphate pyrophosphorylase